MKGKKMFVPADINVFKNNQPFRIDLRPDGPMSRFIDVDDLSITQSADDEKNVVDIFF